MVSQGSLLKRGRGGFVIARGEDTHRGEDNGKAAVQIGVMWPQTRSCL